MTYYFEIFWFWLFSKKNIPRGQKKAIHATDAREMRFPSFYDDFTCFNGENFFDDLKNFHRKNCDLDISTFSFLRNAKKNFFWRVISQRRNELRTCYLGVLLPEEQSISALLALFLLFFCISWTFSKVRSTRRFMLLAKIIFSNWNFSKRLSLDPQNVPGYPATVLIHVTFFFDDF